MWGRWFWIKPDEKEKEADLERGETVSPNLSQDGSGPSMPMPLIHCATKQGNDITCENGRALQGFEIGKMLGAGGFGAVRVCKKHIDGVKYALKGCPVPDDMEEIKFTLREIQTMARMPEANNVIRYYDAWLETTTPELQALFVDREHCPIDEETGKRIVPKYILFMQLELCDTSLSAWINKREPRSVDDVWDIFRQIVEGLCYIHKLGFIHRDLKPANVLLSIGKDGRIRAKLGDLGLARSKERQHRNSVVSMAESVASMMSAHMNVNHDVSVNITQCVGTLTYMAPEQMSSGRYTNKVDMYALGIVLFEMMSSFPNNNVRQMEIHALRSLGKPPKRSQVHMVGAHAVELVSRLVAADPNKRLSALEVLNTELMPNDEPSDMTPAVEAYLKREKLEIEKRILQRVGMSLDVISENNESITVPNTERCLSIPGTPTGEKNQKTFDECVVSVDSESNKVSKPKNSLSLGLGSEEISVSVSSVDSQESDGGASFEVVVEEYHD